MSMRIRLAAALSAAFSLCLVSTASAATRDHWVDTPSRALPADVEAPDAYRALNLDFRAMEAEIARSGGVGVTLSVPRPDGGFADFVLSDSGTMPPELVAKYPRIRSYRATTPDGLRARVDLSPIGLNIMVFDHHDVWVVRPVRFGEGSEYVAFSRRDAEFAREPFNCGVHGEYPTSLVPGPAPATTTGVIKRTYRAAVAANSPYVTAIAAPAAPTVEIGLAAVTVAMNRVNEVYENDLSIHMTLVPNNDLVIYPTSTTDPYSNGTGALNQNTGNLNTVIGATNYDIGHVFTTGSGGVAGLGVVCGSGKGRGTTGLSSQAALTSDVFYIDYVAHEMGHQFGGNHTFNNSCGGNRSGSSAYEPGSGSTIMAYAGICPPDLQNNSDPYFHARSLQEIGTFSSNASSGGLCSVNAANHLSPVVAPLTNMTIPSRTPFVLSGSATSAAPNAALTYSWEQYDLGSATTNIAVDPGNGPIIRSLTPTTSGVRTVPKFENLLSGATMVGELLPTTERNLTFRLTVFDNAPTGGTSESRDVTLAVKAAAGPFAVTAPAGGVTWDGNTNPQQLVTWNVAGTDAAPISCASVDIDLYTGGPFTSSAATLATAVPNTGTATVNVPAVDTTTARVRVRCSNNIFFAMSPGNFTVVGASVDLLFADGFDPAVVPTFPPTLAKAFSPTSILVNATSTLTLTLSNPNATPATLTAALVDTFPTGLVVAPTPNGATTCPGGTVTVTTGANSVTLSSGATIPASASCTVSVSVTSATEGSYVNTIAAGALQTDVGDNAGAASATLTVTNPANNVVCSAPLNHAVANNTNGTAINWITGSIVDADPATGYDINLYGNATGLTVWWNNSPAISAGVAASTTSSDLSVLAAGAVVGPSSVFSRTNGAMTAWRAGTATGSMGFRFNCSSLGTSPSGTCYGYLRMTTTSASGFPATLNSYCYDRSGAAITVASP